MDGISSIYALFQAKRMHGLFRIILISCSGCTNGTGISPNPRFIWLIQNGSNKACIFNDFSVIFCTPFVPQTPNILILKIRYFLLREIIVTRDKKNRDA
jgi:hypothetical protein